MQNAPNSWQALIWLYEQTIVPTYCVLGRLNLMGGLILWELRKRARMGEVPRLFLYGRDEKTLYKAAFGIAEMITVPMRMGRVTTTWRRIGYEDTSEILVARVTKNPPRNMYTDRHAFIIFVGSEYPLAWVSDTFAARRILPIRVGNVKRTYGIPDPNPVKLICDKWLEAKKPITPDVGHYCWPTETAEWKETVDNVLVFSRWCFKPRSIATLDDL